MSESTFSLRTMALKVYTPSLLYSVGLGAVMPVIALSARDRGASIATAALVITLIGVGSLLSNVPAALITAKFGERKAMTAAAAWAAIGMGLGIFDSELGVFAIGVLMIGMAGSVFNLARQSYLAEAVPPEFRARAMSTLGGVSRIGVFIGPFVAAALMSLIGIAGAYWVGLVALLAAMFISLRIPDLDVRQAPASADGVPHKITMGRIAKENWRPLATVGLGVFCIAGVRASRQVVIPLWADHLGLDATTASLIYGLAGAIDMLVFYPAGKVMDRRGRTWVAVPCMTIMAVALGLVPLASGATALLLTAMLLGFGNGIGSGIVMTLGADHSPEHGRPQFLGLWRLMADGGVMAGPVLLSVVAASASLATGIWAVAGISLLGAGLFGYFIPRSRPVVSRRLPGNAA